ncbi:MAG TPA: efflux RND transporter periplasmic adaptor subunit [Solimonas sp.]|jgi:cobalt-zinc-cadmium efflux system membrane fusion protein|nr:efflux RND transporter periplasmic adaptor subunit [Solimonas sp.]
MKTSFKPAANAIAVTLAAAVLVMACGGSAPSSATATKPASEAGHGPDAIKLSDEQLRNAGIEFAVAGPAGIRETLPLYGVIVPNAERVRDVAARYPGVIHAVSRKIGDSVRQGDVLATIESNESLQTYSLTAPLAGVITQRNANPGEQTGEKILFTVADLSTVWVELSLFPRDLPKVRLGQKVRVKVGDGGRQADGTIVYVAPFGSVANQTLTARVLLQNADGSWAPGLYVTADITLSEVSAALAVRSEALQTVEGRTVVFVRKADGVIPQPVQLGRGDSEFVEILGGLAAGERYATKNSYTLKAELGKKEAGHDD